MSTENFSHDKAQMKSHKRPKEEINLCTFCAASFVPLCGPSLWLICKPKIDRLPDANKEPDDRAKQLDRLQMLLRD
jgi:hypothetical protein